MTILDTKVIKVKRGVPTVVEVTFKDNSGNTQIRRFSLVHESA